MKFLVQRVTKADVTIDKKITGEIQKGFLVFVGVSQTDTRETADKMVKKLLNLRLFEDENGKTNLSIADVQGELLVGADMKVSLLNDGPFTVMLDSDELFYLAFWCLLSSSLTATSWDPKFWAIPRAYQASGLSFHHDIQRLFRPSGHDSRRSYLCGDLRRCKGAYQ